MAVVYCAYDEAVDPAAAGSLGYDYAIGAEGWSY